MYLQNIPNSFTLHVVCISALTYSNKHLFLFSRLSYVCFHFSLWEDLLSITHRVFQKGCQTHVCEYGATREASSSCQKRNEKTCHHWSRVLKLTAQLWRFFSFIAIITLMTVSQRRLRIKLNFWASVRNAVIVDSHHHPASEWHHLCTSVGLLTSW